VTLLSLRRLLLAISFAAAAWWVAVALAGGFVLRLGSVRISSRNQDGPAILTIAALVGALALLFAPSARTRWRDEWNWWRSRLERGARPIRFLLIPAVGIAIIAACFDLAQWWRAAPFWVDEEMIAINLRDRSLADLAGPLWLGQSAPLAWLLLQRVVILSLGPADVTLRLVPVLFGVATYAVAVWIGRRWMNPVGAALLVLLCALGKWLSFFRFEMKHYSADAFFALLLPALAAWAIEGDERRQEQRWRTWWVVAALAQLFSNGGLLVTPICALIVTWIILRARGARRALRFGASGLIWVVAAAVNYALSLQYTHHSKFLRGYWADALPLEGTGLFDRLAWAVHRFDDLARDPAGTSLVTAFWVCAIAGFIFSRSRSLGLLLASVPFSTVVLGVLGLVPLSGRISLWMVPALYAGIALLFDAASAHVVDGWRARRWASLIVGMGASLASVWVGADIVAQGKPALEFAARQSNHGLDDRTAVKWVMDRRQPPDAIVTTHLGWPALWWYGGISLGQPRPRGQLPDGGVMYEAVHERARPDCGELTRDALKGRRRVLVHVGFPDVADGFYELLLRQLAPFGTLVDVGKFADFSRTAVVTLHEPETIDSIGEPGMSSTELTGCVTFRAARRW
jgi:hypothetical protein